MRRKDLLNITAEMHLFIEERASMPRHQLKDELNQAFGTELTYEQVRSYCKRNRIMTGRTGCFKKGNKPTHPGRIAKEGIKTRFKAGRKPWNHAPVGSLRIFQGGYHQVKVSDTGYPPRDWKFVHRLLWEEHNGPIPPGHKVIFIDGDRDNIMIKNLELVSSGELAVINKRSLNDVAPELRPAAINLGKLIHKIARISRESKS